MTHFAMTLAAVSLICFGMILAVILSISDANQRRTKSDKVMLTVLEVLAVAEIAILMHAIWGNV